MSQNLPVLLTAIAPLPPSSLAQPGGIFVPAMISTAGEETLKRFLEFFVAHIRNPNTRLAYGRAVSQFFTWCEQRGIRELSAINSLVVSAYIEQHPASPPTVKQHLSAIRQLFTWLEDKKMLTDNPAEEVKGPKHRVKVGKTPVLETEDARRLFASFDRSHVVGLRDRALVGLMTYTFARISAVLGMDVEDYHMRGKRPWVRLHEKGGKVHELPLHPVAEEYLDLYIEMAKRDLGDGFIKKTPLFRSVHGKTKRLTENRLTPRNAQDMIKRRLADAGIEDDASPHSFRAMGLTNYLENGGSLDTAQEIAAHEDIRTTKLYDRRREKVSFEEILRVRF